MSQIDVILIWSAIQASQAPPSYVIIHKPGVGVGECIDQIHAFARLPINIPKIM